MEYRAMVKKWIFLGLLITLKAQAESFTEGPVEPFSAEIENILLHSGTDKPLNTDLSKESQAEPALLEFAPPILEEARHQAFNHLLHKKLYSSFPQVLSVPSTLKSLSEEKQILFSLFLESDEIPPYIHTGKEFASGSKESSTDFSFYQAAFEEYKARYQANKAEGALGLGILYREGLGVEKSSVKALSYFEEAASLNDPLALTSLGFFYHTGEMTAQNRSQAIQYYKNASKSDQGGIATALLAEILLLNPSTLEEEEEGRFYLNQSLDKGTPYAFVVEAYHMLHQPHATSITVEVSILKEALALIKKAAEKGVNVKNFQEDVEEKLNWKSRYLESEGSPIDKGE